MGMMLQRLLALGICLLAMAAPVAAAQYKVVIKRLDANVFQAQASKVIIETRRCDAWLESGERQEEAVLNWEGAYGNNWILFIASGTRCDVSLIR
jgi:hypothetical protein